ncbi:MAG: ABC transporter substrate-binding protein [Hydrogenoanaerobacterium sp.]
MKKTKRTLLVYILCVLFLLLCGCGKSLADIPVKNSGKEQKSNAEEAVPPDITKIDSIKIAYNNTDSLSPYLATSTVNINIMPLIYDSLVKTDRQYEIKNLLAEKIDLTKEQCSVKIRSGITFSDGSPLTPADVVYSATQVMAGESAYQGLLSNVTEVTAAEDGTIIFKLKAPDRLFANLLTFPIVCESVPNVGSGRFVLKGSGESTQLVPNPLWFGQSNDKIKKIELINQLDKETLIYSLKLGTINYAYSDLSGNEALALGISTQAVPLNNLVYLGINSTSKLLSDIKMREAINVCLNRPQLAEGAYAARATAAYTPFNPAIPGIAALDIKRQSYTEATALMTQLGYKSEEKDSDGYYTTKTNRLSLRILVNKDNLCRMQLAADIQRQLKELGIQIIIDARSFDEYKAALTKWDFDLYIAEVKLYNNRDITFLLSGKSSLGFGAANNDALMAANAALMAGDTDEKSFLTEFDNTLPFLPLLYRSGMVAFSREVTFERTATEQDIFYNIENW